MNKNILNTENQIFIKKNLRSDISSLLLKKELLKGASTRELVEQIKAKNKCKTKLPTWYNTPNIYYPNKLNIEQTSSETTAQYKANLVSGASLVDLTGGLGIDDFYFHKNIDQVIHCEINSELSEIASHNFKQLGATIKCVVADGIDFIRQLPYPVDWIYIDPSRRNDRKGKVFLLEDCVPDVPNNLDCLFNTSENILIKNSPLLDLDATIKSLKFTQNIYILAVKNEVKEVLFYLKKDYSGPITVISENLLTDQPTFICSFNEKYIPQYSLPQAYLYEPNAAIMKSGAFNTICKYYEVHKLHVSSHLYTTNHEIDFPGRKFKIEAVFPYNKKELKKRFNKRKLNITTRNFPKTVAELKKECNSKDGGQDYVFFTTNHENNKIVILCSKL